MLELELTWLVAVSALWDGWGRCGHVPRHIGEVEERLWDHKGQAGVVGSPFVGEVKWCVTTR